MKNLIITLISFSITSATGLSLILILLVGSFTMDLKAQNAAVAQQNNLSRVTNEVKEIKEKSFDEIIDYSKNFNELVGEMDAFFAEKYPGLSAEDLVEGEHRDGTFVKYQRWKHYWEYLIDADGNFPNITAKYNEVKARKAAKKQLKSSQQSANPLSDEQWNNIAHDYPLHGGVGRTTYIAFHPTNKNIFYVAAAQGGIWKTEDEGQTYTPLGDDLPMLSVSAIVIDKNTPSTIYIAISDHVSYGPSGIGIYKSTDGGENWEPTSLTFEIEANIRIYDMAADPNNPSKMFVATGDGLYVTFDGFQSYTKVFSEGIYKIEYASDSSDLLYLSTLGRDFYKSVDGGLTWVLKLNTGSGSKPYIAVSRTNPQKVCVGIVGNLFISTDEGESFIRTTPPSNGGPVSVAISPRNENVITHGFIQLDYTIDNGVTWNRQFSTHVDFRNAHINPLDNDHIYWCNDGGVLRQNVINNTIEKLSTGLRITQYYDIAQSTTNPNVVAGGSQDNGSTFRNDNDQWAIYKTVGDGMIQAIDPSNDNIRYWEYQQGNIYRTEFNANGGRAHYQIRPATGGAWVTPYRLDETNPNRIIAGYDYIYESLDRGDTWETISPKLGTKIRHVAIPASNPEKLYATINNLYVKNTADDDWTTYDLPTGTTVSDMEVDPLDENIVYLSFSNYDAGNKIFKSIDGGASWINLTKGLENIVVLCLELYNEVEGGLFIGTNFGVYYTDDSLSGWYEYGELPHVQVRDIEIQYNEQLIRAATHGRGIYEANINIDLCAANDTDSDADGICDEWDACPLMDDDLLGQPCDDADDCTENDIYTSICDCEGTTIDLNENGICDTNELWQSVPNYCLSDGVGATGDNWITRILINSTDNSSAKTYYSDFTYFNTILTVDSTYALGMKVNYPYAASRAYAWIDWNKDFVLDDSEEIAMSSFAGGWSTGTVTVPSNAVADSILLRTRIIRNGTDNGPCDTQNGEVEDYLLIVEQCNDTDNDDICTVDDLCPNLDNNLFGTACNDNDPCTIGETYDFSCNCSGGTLVLDINNNDICDNDEVWQDTDNYCSPQGTTGTGADWIKNISIANINNTSQKTRYSDFTFLSTHLIVNNAYELKITANHVFGNNNAFAWIDWNKNFIMENSEAIAMSPFSAKVSTGTVIVPSNAVLDSVLIRTRITGSNMQITSPTCGNYVGEVEDYLAIIFDCNDTDNDGICDADDQCSGFNDNLIGQPCDDNDPCTGGETYDANCNCTGGTLLDDDHDGICNLNDICPDFDETWIGQPCEDYDNCTMNTTIDENCNCTSNEILDINDNDVCDNDELWQHVPDHCYSVGKTLGVNDWIKNVSLNTINNTSGKTGYTNFTLYNTILEVDSTYTLSIEANAVHATSTNAFAWIDWNRDFVLDDTEQVAMSSFDANKVSTGTVTVPSNAPIDSILLRTRTINATDSVAYPCDAYEGEVEDYLIIIGDCIDTKLYAALEGTYDAASGEMTTALNTRGLLPGQTPLSNLVPPTPAGQPYSAAPWNYAGTQGANWTDANYTGNETDWVLVSFRTGTAKNTEVGMTAGLLMKDGSISFPNRCALTPDVANPLYIVLEHRNHIGVMTPQPINLIGSTLTYDFRLSDSYRDLTSFGQKQTSTGEWVMFAGDADQSDFPSFDIQGTDKTIWFENNGVFDYYFSPDFNLDGDINGQDKSLWFDNNGISSRVPK